MHWSLGSITVAQRVEILFEAYIFISTFTSKEDNIKVAKSQKQFLSPSNLHKTKQKLSSHLVDEATHKRRRQFGGGRGQKLIKIADG